MKCNLFIILIIFTLLAAGGCNLSNNNEEKPEDMAQIESPVFSLQAGTYNEDIFVELSCITTDAIIYYTTDGSSPSSASYVYTLPIPITGHGTLMTINAMAAKEGMTDSESVSAGYSINYELASPPTFDPPGGTYNSDIEVVINCATEGATLYYTTNGDKPGITSMVYEDPIPLQANTTIKARAIKAGMIDSEVAGADYVISCAPPVFSLPPGTYDGPLNITMSSTTDDAIIYYTIDGNTPTTQSLEYTGPVIISGNGLTINIMAYAVKEGMGDSAVTSAVYSIPLEGIYVDIGNSSGIEDGSYTNPFTVIQDGIDAAGTNETIFVAPGIYMENIILKSNIVLQGAGAEVTTIDGSNGGQYARVIEIPDGYYHDITVRGLRVTGTCYKGIANGGNYSTMHLSAITIHNNIFEGIGYYDNHYSWEGLAIHLFVIDNSTFSNNRIINNPEYSMAIVRGQDITIVNNVIADNYFGLNISDPLAGTIYIKNNIITGNEVRGVTLNSASFPPPALSYNNVWNNGTANFFNCSQGTGGFSSDPLFRDPENGDYHLTTGSPCIDTGDPDPAYNDINGTRNDMGAYGGPAGE